MPFPLQISAFNGFLIGALFFGYRYDLAERTAAFTTCENIAVIYFVFDEEIIHKIHLTT